MVHGCSELQHSIDTAACHFDLQGRRVNLIDTPGHLDLMGGSQAALLVAMPHGIRENWTL
jgi:translation elongation factor EF-G